MGESNARILIAGFPTREALRDSLLHDIGGVFVAGEHKVVTGEEIGVLVQVSGIESGLVMRGTVLWRRIFGTSRAPTGVGVRFASTEGSRFAFLCDLALGDARGKARIGARYPVTIPVAFLLSRTTTVRAGTLADVSELGALLHVAEAPPVDDVVVVRLRDGRSGPPLPFRVTWSHTGAAGLLLLGERPDLCRFWEHVVAAARTDLERRLIE